MPHKPQRKKRKFVPYDYEKEISQAIEDLDHQQWQQIVTGSKKFEYVTKTIKAGALLDIEIYPEFTHLPAGVAKRKKDPAVQKALNDKNSRKECIRLINENFGPNDYWATFSYRAGCEPEEMEEAQKNIKNYIRKVNYHRKKAGLAPSRYVYVTEWEKAGKSGEEIRCHHHLVIDGDFPRDKLEDLWTLGDRNQIRRLNIDRHGLTGLGCYITKAPKGKKKWCASLGLKRPPETKNYSKFRPSKVSKMAFSPSVAALEIEKQYPGYWLEQTEIKCNPQNKMLYISASMRRKARAGEKVMLAQELLEGAKIPLLAGGFFEVESLRTISPSHGTQSSTKDWAWIKKGKKRYFVPLIALVTFGR